MPAQLFEVAADPSQALEQIRNKSQDTPVLVFKKSPICPVSHHAEDEYRSWLATTNEATCSVVEIDVIEEKPLARGLTAELEIRHESPQALWFVAGQLRWHASHQALTQAKFQEVSEEHPLPKDASGESA